MPDFETILRNFSGAVSNDQRFAKLLRDLEAHSHDGTEIHHIVRQELRGLEHSDAANNIMRAIEAKYRDCIQRYIVLELVGKFLDDLHGDNR
jgi:hypothetical protein